MPVESQRWRCVEAVPALLFSVEGPGVVDAGRGPRLGRLTVAEGLVHEVDAHTLVLEGDVRLCFFLPERVDLTSLLGQHVKLALNDETSTAGPHPQTLSITDAAGRPLVVARFGPAGHVHTIGRSRVRGSLSQRPDGPMVFGTDRLQYVVQVGQHVRVCDGSGDLVVCFVARTAYDYVAYVIVDRALWTERPRR
jgi:hypothetical protein